MGNEKGYCTNRESCEARFLGSELLRNLNVNLSQCLIVPLCNQHLCVIIMCTVLWNYVSFIEQFLCFNFRVQSVIYLGGGGEGQGSSKLVDHSA